MDKFKKSQNIFLKRDKNFLDVYEDTLKRRSQISLG